MYLDSAGSPIEKGNKVKFRGKTYTIKEFFPGEGSYGTARIKFEEEQHVEEPADETKVDFIPFTAFAKRDDRPQKGMWAPGNYMCTCTSCKEKFVGDKRAVTCADCAYLPDRAVLHDEGIVTIDNIALPVMASEDFTSTEWDKVIGYYPEYEKHCIRLDVRPMDRLAYVLGFCRKLEEAKIERDGKPRTAETWFWRISDHWGRAWFNEKVLGSAAKFFSGF